jgi:hypothetical protein
MKPKPPPLIRVGVYLEADVYREFRAWAALSGTTVSEWARLAMLRTMYPDGMPNSKRAKP